MPDAKVNMQMLNDRGWFSLFYCGPRLHEYLQGIGQILIEYDAFSVGEMPACNDPEEIIKAVNIDRHELNMIFNFELVDIDHGNEGKFYSWKLEAR